MNSDSKYHILWHSSDLHQRSILSLRYCKGTLTRHSETQDCEIGGLDCHVITTEYKTRVHCIHM